MNPIFMNPRKSSFNFKVHSDLRNISKDFKGILLDAYGVFWQGNSVGLLSGCKEAMEQLINKGKIIGILSNSTQLAKNEIDKLNRHGLLEGKHFHFFITSGEVTKKICWHERFPFPTPQKKFYVFGEVHPKFSSHQAIFNGTPYKETNHLNEADFIYISIPHIDGEDQTDPFLFKEKLKEITHAKIPMLCVNPDRYAHEGNPPQAVVRQGSIAVMYEGLGGEVFYIGKPSEIMYEQAMHLFQQYKIFNPGEVLMVGDTPETDIRGAQRFGMPSALVTETGIMSDRIAHQGLELVIKSLTSQDLPTFFIKCLANNES